MCGSVQMSWMEKAIFLDEGNAIPKEAFTTEIKRDIPISDNKFIRSENIKEWQQKVKLHPTMIKVQSYDEQGKKIVLPQGYGIKGFIHQSTRGWVFSILTTDPKIGSMDQNIDKVRREVLEVHNRMPVIAPIEEK